MKYNNMEETNVIWMCPMCWNLNKNDYQTDKDPKCTHCGVDAEWFNILTPAKQRELDRVIKSNQGIKEVFYLEDNSMGSCDLCCSEYNFPFEPIVVRQGRKKLKVCRLCAETLKDKSIILYIKEQLEKLAETEIRIK